jgi:putative ABC transport system ATP-binding protein
VPTDNHATQVIAGGLAGARPSSAHNGNPAPVLDFQGVSRHFDTPAGPVHVLHDVNVVVHGGDFAILTGPSGSGKTTFLNIASLLDQPSSGSVQFIGHRVDTLPPRDLAHLRQARLGMVFQRFHLLTRRTALENVMFRFRYTTTQRREARQLALDALETVGLLPMADRPARLLSGGEMQRVAIARAMANPPDLLIADEPTGNLDADNAEHIMALFRAINQRGIAILLATHNPALLRHGTRHLKCQNGTLVEASP